MILMYWSSISCSDFQPEQTVHQFSDIDTDLAFTEVREVSVEHFAMAVAC